MALRVFDSSKPENKYFYSLSVNPRATFEGQIEGEKVYLLLRRHPITFTGWILASIILFFIPLGLNILLFNILEVTEVIFINIFWYSGLFSYVFMHLLSWIFNVGLVTSNRIIDFDYNMILYKEVTASTIEDIAEVTSRTSGFIRTLFRYGDVLVQTQARDANIEFSATPQPDEVVAVINQLMEQANG